MFVTPDQTGEAEFPFPKAVVFRALGQAVAATTGMEAEEIDHVAGRLVIKTGMTLLSWGERVVASVFDQGAMRSRLAVKSAPKTIVGSGLSHTRNRKNVAAVIKATSEILAKRGELWTNEMGLRPAAPAPSAPTASIADELVKLGQLRQEGLLTEAEFETQKARLLR